MGPPCRPQWQIVTAHALASGWVEVDGARVEFRDAAAYVEKNWGAGFPPKWFWLQCNSFEDRPGLTVTAVGARRRAVEPAGGLVDVGIMGVHWEGDFVECVPWNAKMRWEVQRWGQWQVRRGRGTRRSQMGRRAALSAVGAACDGGVAPPHVRSAPCADLCSRQGPHPQCLYTPDCAMCR